MSNESNAAPAVDPNTLKTNEIARTVLGTGVHVDDFRVEFSGGTATVRGSAHSEEEKQRVLTAVRGVSGVTSVTDSLKVGAGTTSGSGAGGQSYTVQAGDTLSKIAKHFYGDASKYPQIFDANRNILSDADKIQTGQVLNIPAEK